MCLSSRSVIFMQWSLSLITQHRLRSWERLCRRSADWTGQLLMLLLCSDSSLLVTFGTKNTRTLYSENHLGFYTRPLLTPHLFFYLCPDGQKPLIIEIQFKQFKQVAGQTKWTKSRFDSAIYWATLLLKILHCFKVKNVMQFCRASVMSIIGLQLFILFWEQLTI